MRGLTCGKHLHDCITSLRGYVWTHKTSLSPLHFIKVLIINQESEWSCILCWGYWFYLCFYGFTIGVWNCFGGVVSFLFYQKNIILVTQYDLDKQNRRTISNIGNLITVIRYFFNDIWSVFGWKGWILKFNA